MVQKGVIIIVTLPTICPQITAFNEGLLYFGGLVVEFQLLRFQS